MEIYECKSYQDAINLLIEISSKDYIKRARIAKKRDKSIWILECEKFGERFVKLYIDN